MNLNQGQTGWKNSREREKNTADCGSKKVGDDASRYRDQTAQQESDCVLLQRDVSQARKLDSYLPAHFINRPNPRLMPSHTGIKQSAARLADQLVVAMTRLTHHAYTQNATAPPIIERASSAEYCKPCFSMVRRRVARAIDGAAPKRPAKLFGSRMSERIANADTKMPPIRKRIAISAAFIVSDRPFLRHRLRKSGLTSAVEDRLSSNISRRDRGRERSLLPKHLPH